MVHVTVVPGATVSDCGMNAKFWIVTAAVAAAAGWVGSATRTAAVMTARIARRCIRPGIRPSGARGLPAGVAARC